MAEMVDPGSYQEVINQLRAFSSKVFEQCTNMTAAARTCASAMEGDSVAERSIGSLERCISQINQGLQQINSVISGMQRELEDAQKAQAKANFD